MKNKLNIFKCLLLIIISAITLSGCSLMDFLFPTEAIETYSFSGYVFADGLALEGADVSCGLSQTITDERGYYSFSGLTKVVQVEVSKSGYYFDNTLVYVKDNKDNVNFEGNKYFDVNGIVKNGNKTVGGATVSVTSSLGTYSTIADSEGNFYLSNLIGTARVSANFEDMQFFTQEVNKETNFVTINSALDILSTINCDAKATGEDFTIKLNNNKVDTTFIVNNNTLTFNIKNVTPNSVISIESENYYIENNTVTITDSREISFNCEKYYSATIQTISGTTPLTEATVTVNNEPVLVSRVDNRIILNNLHGENIFNATCHGFTFEPKTSNFNNTDISLVGKFNLQLNIVTDDNKFEDIKVFVNSNELNILNGSLIAQDIELNSIVTILSDNYFIEDSVNEVTTINELIFNLYRYYTLNLQVAFADIRLPETEVTINESNYNLNTNGELIVENLYGENNLKLNLAGYKFNDYTISLTNNVINAVAKKLFNLFGTVTSGNLVLSNATVAINETTTLTNENGEFTFKDLYESGKVVVAKQGYNKKELNFEIDNDELNINLTYNITGTVLCGESALSDVTVACGENSMVTGEDGTFILYNLQGQSEVTFIKNYYNIATSVVTSEEEITKNSTYNITGVVTDSGGNEINNLLIILNDVNASNSTVTTVTRDGIFTFNNLTSEYLLTYGEVDFTLKPNYHIVTVGGEYNFSNNGYGFSGRVMCGETGVSGVRIKTTTGEQVVYTDEQGYYTFALITKPTELSLYKQGYTFVNNDFAVNEEMDERTDINFYCSYSVYGTVLSGNTAMQNVVVNINGKEVLTDVNGYYEIANLEGSGTIRLSKQGYTFVGENFVTTYANLNFKGYYTAKYKIVTGNIAVSDVTVNVNNKQYTTDENGFVTIENTEIGLPLTLAKQGYNFTNITLNGYSENAQEINCTYNVSGTVYSGTNAVENCLVAVGEINVYTNQNGEFVINYLQGENVLTFTLENFQFEPVTVTSPSNLEVYAKYTVTGIVKVGNTALSNVTITAGKFTTTTNGAGKFEIKGLTTRVTLVLQKEGYEFEGNFEVNSPCDLEFSASYMVCGFVTSGSHAVADVLVTSSFGGQGVLTNNEGYYEVKSQTGIITLTFEKDGYKTVTSQEINSYTSNLNINLSYSVKINFSGVDDYSGIFITVNGVRKEYASKTVILNDLTGTNNLKFSKTGYSLTPSEYGVEGYTVIDITIVRYYSANFNVKTDNGINVNDIILQVGAKQATNVGDGNYVADELSNKVNVFAYLTVKDDAGNNLYNKQIAGPIIDSEGNYNITINNTDYSYFMYVRAYERLRQSYAYRVAVKGTVSPKIGGNQNVTMVYKKVDTERLYENLNYGSEIMGVDPRVTLLTYTDLDNKNVKYQTVSGNNVKDGSATYTTDWTETNYQGYQSVYGVSPEGFFPYNITNATIVYASLSNLIFSNNTYQFTMQFGSGESSPANDLVVANYRTLMNRMVTKQQTGAYHYIKLTFTFNQNGDILTLLTDEAYSVTSMSVTVATTATMTYTYTTSNNTSISKIDISSNDAIRKTLNETLPQDTINTVKVINTYILNKRRDLV